MWYRSICATMAALVLPTQAVADPAGPPTVADIGRRMDAAIDRALAERRIVGTVVLVSRDGRIIYRRAAGYADREASAPMRENTVFRLASVSKPYVAVAAMRLVERGIVSLDDPVTKYLPRFRPALPDGSRPEITLRQLMTHRSGLGYGFEEKGVGPYRRLKVSDGLDQPGLSLATNLDRLARAPLLSRPGSSWRYSLGIDVLGAALEQATGKSLAAIVRDEVTMPLELADTGFDVPEKSRLATAYANRPRGPVRMTDGISVPLGPGAVTFAPSRALDAASYASGGAGMTGTAGDLLRLLEVVRTDGVPLLQPDTVAEMRRDQVGAAAATQGPGWGFGFGWAVLDDPAPTRTPQAAETIQWGGAYGHSWFVDPANRLTVVALTNTALEGMTGRFPTEVRDAAYASGERSK